MSVAAKHDMIMALMTIPAVDDDGNETGETFSLITAEEALVLMSMSEKPHIDKPLDPEPVPDAAGRDKLDPSC